MPKIRVSRKTVFCSFPNNWKQLETKYKGEKTKLLLNHLEIRILRHVILFCWK